MSMDELSGGALENPYGEFAGVLTRTIGVGAEQIRGPGASAQSYPAAVLDIPRIR
jgi:hypothetical protein